MQQEETMNAYELTELLNVHNQQGRLYLEFLRAPALSMGLYILKANSADPQQPHSEDEVYYIVSGKGMIYVGGEDHVAQAGSVIYVAANIEHRFHSIVEDLTILVFFAPAEYSRKSQE
jgi:quercetin dioxygenase-like cupin family protein